MVKKFSLFSLLSLSLIGCAFFGIEDFPSYLPYVREVIDINGLLSNKNVANYTLVAGKFIKLGKKQYIAAHVASQQNPTDILGIILSEQNNPSNSMWISRDVFTLSGGIISRYLFPSVKNYLASGNREFNPISASITTNLSFNIGANDLKNFNYLFPNGSFNYVFQIYFNGSSKIIIDLKQFDQTFSPSGSQSCTYIIPPFQLSGSIDDFIYLDILRWSDNIIAVLVGQPAQGKGEVALFEIDLTMSSIPSYLNSVGSGFPLFNIDHAMSSLWLTHDGVIGFDRSNRQLIFYDINNLSQKNSTLSISQDFIPLGFSEDGESWLAFDKTKRKIYRLRSWW
jgi:hypothetical protein